MYMTKKAIELRLRAGKRRIKLPMRLVVTLSFATDSTKALGSISVCLSQEKRKRIAFDSVACAMGIRSLSQLVKDRVGSVLYLDCFFRGFRSGPVIHI